MATTREGPAAFGRVGGRPIIVNDDHAAGGPRTVPNPDDIIESIAHLLGVTRAITDNHIPDLLELRATAPEPARRMGLAKA